MNDVRTGRYSCKQAASIYNIKRTTLRSESSLENNNSILELTDDQKIEIGNYVLVQFSTKTTIVLYR